MNEDLEALRIDYCEDCPYENACYCKVPKSGDCQSWQDEKNSRAWLMYD